MVMNNMKKDKIDDNKKGLNVEEVDALKFAFKLNESQHKETNKILEDYRNKLEEENAFLRDENERLCTKLDRIEYALEVLRMG